MSAVRVIETIGSHEGSVVTLDVDGERATCRVDSDFNVLEVSFGAPGDGA